MGGLITIKEPGQTLEELVDFEEAKLKEETIARWLDVINSKNIEESKREFVISVISTLYDKSLVSGIPIEIMFGQMMTESDHGSDHISQNANNYFGMKGIGPAGSYKSGTKEETASGDIIITDKFKKYNNMNESIEDYIGWINRNVASNVTNNSVQAWEDALEASKYATRSDYGNSTLNVANYWGGTGN